MYLRGGDVLERADVGVSPLRPRCAIEVVTRDHIRRIGDIDRSASRLEMEIAVVGVVEHWIAGDVPGAREPCDRDG